MVKINIHSPDSSGVKNSGGRIMICVWNKVFFYEFYNELVNSTGKHEGIHQLTEAKLKKDPTVGQRP